MITILNSNSDLSSLHSLNEVHSVELSSLTLDQFCQLVASAFYSRAILPDRAFLIAFDNQADYQGTNFLWFKERFSQFVYIDRIAVNENARGQGLARNLYEDLFEKAKCAGHTRIVCEVNSEPPNPASDAFHQSMGFVAIGSAQLKDKNKTVRYFEKKLV